VSSGALSRRQFLGGAAVLGTTAVGVAAFAGGVPLPGRAPAKVPLVGFLAPSVHPDDVNTRAFQDGLNEQGLVDGRDLHLLAGSAPGD
jgi:hypothetical protein